MNMGLAVSTAAPAANAQPQQPAAASGQKAQAAQANAKFGRILVARVNGMAGGGEQNGQTSSAPAIARRLPGGEWVNPLAAASGDALLDKLDALLTLLEGGDIPLSEEQRVEIGAVLKELNALMTAMFGIELPMEGDGRIAISALLQQSAADIDAGTNAETEAPEGAAVHAGLHEIMTSKFGIGLPMEGDGRIAISALLQQSAADIDAGTNAETEAPEGAAVRAGLYETLAFVRSFLAEGAFRPLTRQEQALFESLAGRLQRALAATDGTADRQSAEADGPVIQVRTSDRGNPPSTEALLARLSRRPMQASVAAMMTETGQTDVSGSDGNASSARMAEETVNRSQAPIGGMQPQAAIDAEAVRIAAADAAEPMPAVQPVQTTNANEAPLVARTETTVRHSVPVVPVERFHELVSGMAVRQFSVLSGNGVSEARILLVPEHLGEVAVRITLQNGQLTAQFVTENATARELIEHQFAQLRVMLQNQGIQVDRLEVTQGSPALQSQLFQDQRQRGGQARHEGGRDKRDGDAVPVFETELIEQAAIRELGYGRAINVKA